jgi:hypothetical protein
MSKLVKHMNALRDLLVLAAVQVEQLDLPKFRYDGEEAKAEDVAAELRIPIQEAAVRLGGPLELKRFEVKDVYSGQAAHDVRVGVGTTIQQRIHRYIGRNPVRRKKRRRKRNDGSSGK